MSRLKSTGLGTKFGTFLMKVGITYAEAGRHLNVTGQYVGMLARREATPGLKLALIIELWAEKLGYVVPIDGWKK